ncbi:MAG: biopolymer transporter ExbD [Deltaproteobacteria bacterium]|nr:biopolymer transporter ExbD [Deltaproteobacteria bacterium]
MAIRPSKSRRHVDAVTDIDLTPVMNVFIIIIPFLLLTAVFAKTAIIDVYLPQEGGEQTGASVQQTPKIPLIIKVTGAGFTLDGLGKGIHVPKGASDYDYKRLAERLSELKDSHPQNEEAIILFEPKIRYEIVIKVMDASRETHYLKDGINVKRALFPAVSLGEAG